jgi:prepilin-type N-terminal cleavage/methylation domain-containing protein
MILTTGRPGKSGYALRPAIVRALHPWARRAGRKGFTLVELVLVMLIVCTVLATAAPALRGFFASRRTDDAGAQVLALIQFARSQAAAEGRVYRLNLDLSRNTYWLTAQGATSFDHLGTEFGRTFTFPDGTSVELEGVGTRPDGSYISFYPTGLTEAAVIRLTGALGRVVEVTCQSPTEGFAISTSATGDKR